MRVRLVPLLRCPICIVPLDLEAFVTRGDEIIEGALRCATCRAIYPIIHHIPRMLPEDLAGEMRHRNRDFFARHPGLLPSTSSADGGAQSAPALRRTFRSVSFQWNTFGDMYGFWEENFRDYLRPLTPDFFAGKLGCDAGCGFGRHLRYATRYGAEMVGLDRSEAVLAAYGNNANSEWAHVVQGDIYRPPFARSTFDFIYSIGVLHHLPDPPGAFRALAPYVRPGGTLFAWIDGPRGGVSEVVTRLLRPVTSRLDSRVLYGVCVVVAGALRVFSHCPYRVLSRIPALRPLAQRLPIHDHERYPFKVVVAAALDRLSVPPARYYTADDLHGWIESAGLLDGRVLRRFKNNESFRVFGRIRGLADPGRGASATKNGRAASVAVASSR